LPLAGVGDLARVVQPHTAVGEHLAVQAVFAAVALGQQRGDLVGNRPDSRLQRGAGRNDVDSVLRDGVVDVRGRRFPSRERQRRVGRANQDVDLIGVQRMAMTFA
jgi:cytosine/adenosine deaminase-related metal-dependent hydrolase